MPERLSTQEMIDFIFGLIRGEITAEEAQELHHADYREVVALLQYELDRRRWEADKKKRAKAQRRARALLRSFLTPQQKKHLRDRRGFFVRGSLGGMYRLHPATGTVYRVEKHGKRWFGVIRYCLHDEDNVMPPADLSLGQMLLLLSDEQAFLDEANATDERSRTLWNGDWLRRLNQARRERAAAVAEEAA